jgi:hypothetical protein
MLKLTKKRANIDVVINCAKIKGKPWCGITEQMAKNYKLIFFSLNFFFYNWLVDFKCNQI